MSTFDPKHQSSGENDEMNGTIFINTVSTMPEAEKVLHRW